MQEPGEIPAAERIPQSKKTIVCFQIYYDNFTFGTVLYTELDMPFLFSK